MKSEALTQRITIQEKTITQDAELNSIESWIDWKTIWAAPLDETSREFYRLATNNSEVTKAFKIRYFDGVTAHQRISSKGRYFEIIGEPINISERNIELILTCKGIV